MFICLKSIASNIMHHLECILILSEASIYAASQPTELLFRVSPTLAVSECHTCTNSEWQNVVPMVCTSVTYTDKMRVPWYVQALCVQTVNNKIQAPWYVQALHVWTVNAMRKATKLERRGSEDKESMIYTYRAQR